MENYFSHYLILRDEIDSLTQKLENQHKKHMNCKAGCDLCCMDYSVFPIEFHYILEQLKNQINSPQTNLNASDEACIFLNNHQCTIYEQRPSICRTHGLPLLFVGEEGNWELSACELNFTDFNLEEFSEENTYPQDKYNSKLFMLNKSFIADFKEVQYGDFDLIPIKKLSEYL